MKLSAALVLLATLSACGGTGPAPSTGDPDIDADGDGYPETTDCDDTNADVNPYADEVCNGIDDNCDDVIDPVKVSVYADDDGDGYGTGAVIERCDGAGFATNDTDCDDNNSAVYPGAVELCDGIDNNCDGSIDPDKQNGYVDADADGFGAGPLVEVCDSTGIVDSAGDCDDTNASVSPVGTEACNGIDDDCDTLVDDADSTPTGRTTFYADADGDGYGLHSATTQACAAPSGYVANSEDCDDTSADLNPDTQWFVDADHDSFGTPSTPLTSCVPPSGYARTTDDCDDTKSSVFPGATEICDGLDNDCDGVTDPNKISLYVDADGDGWGAGDLVEVCDSTGYVNINGDCNDASAAISPDATETCDGIDNDCDGLTDDADTPAPTGRQTFYIDSDGDGYGSSSHSALACSAPSGFVSNSDDCDDTSAARNPQTQWYVDADGDGYGVTSAPISSCTPPSGYALTTDDCDDGAPATHPNALGACEDFDKDCDGAPEDDHDNDTYLRAACKGVDCDDEDESKTPTSGGGCTLYNDCYELKKAFPQAPSGKYWFNVAHANPHVVEMTCDMVTDGGGWTLATRARVGDGSRCVSSTGYKPPFALARQVAQKWSQDDGKVGGKLLSHTSTGIGPGSMNSTVRLTLKSVIIGGRPVTPSVYDVLDFNNTGTSWAVSSSFFTLTNLSGPIYPNLVYWNGAATGGKKVDYCIGGTLPEASTTTTRPQTCLPDGTYAAHCKDLGIGSTWQTSPFSGFSDASHSLYIRPPL